MPASPAKILVQTPLDALKKHFGHGGFLDGQERVVGEITSGRDGLVVMPTGGGKSLCYQLPALCFRGVTLVVSPLIALMKDQVDALVAKGIPATLIADSAAAHLMKTGQVQWVVVGADRIAANGDTANKIGTYQLAIAARHHGVKFMVVAPSSTVDMATAGGDDIEIELRVPDELLAYAGQRTVAEGAQAWNPVFDVTPATLIDAIVTERGVVNRPDAAGMAALFGAR